MLSYIQWKDLLRNYIKRQSFPGNHIRKKKSLPDNVIEGKGWPGNYI